MKLAQVKFINNKDQKNTETESTVSVCDIMKNNTSTIIKKMESQIPSYAQSYSDLYSEYLHSLDDLFGTCYIAEKEFFDKLGFDQNTLKAYDSYFKSITGYYSSQIEFSTSFLRTYVETRISAIKSYDSYMHVMMNSYAKMLSQFLETFKK